MATPLVVNGVTFQYPQQFDKNWGPTLTNWSSAVTTGMLQKAGGSFPLTAEVDFGGSFGIKVLSIKSEEVGIASAGILRLANASAGINWRNALGNANLALTVNASNQLTFNGVNVGATTSLTDSHVLVGNASNQPADVAMTGDITITNAGVTAIGAGKVVNAQISASAAVALSKLAPATAYYWYAANASGVLTPLAVTPSRAVVTDANGLPSASAVTATELGYVAGVTSAVQTQIAAKLPLGGGTMSGVLNMGSHKIQSVSAATSTGEALAYGQGFDAGSNRITGIADPTTANDALVYHPWTSYSPSVIGFGTVSNSQFFYSQIGDTVRIRGYFKTGTVNGSTASIATPLGLNINAAKVSTIVDSVACGYYWWMNNQAFGPNSATGALFSDPVSSTAVVYFCLTPGSQAFAKQAGVNIAGSNQGVAVQFDYPI